MSKEIFVAFATQKGGIGKSTVTALAASYLHNVKGYNVAVVDCDDPQHSIHGLREHEMGLIDSSTYFKALACDHFRRIKKNAYTIVKSNAVNALDDAERMIATEDVKPDVVFFDMPGTLRSNGVIKTLSQMDYIFTPLSADRFVVESTLKFVTMFRDRLMTTGQAKTKGLHLFWTMVDGRERNDLYGIYEEVIAEMGFPVLLIGGNLVNNEALTYDGSKWEAARTLYWDEGTYNAYAYYPYIQGVSSTTDQPFSVALDQSTPKTATAPGGYEASDLLFATSKDIQASNSPISLNFKHIMSKLKIRLIKGEDFEGDMPTHAQVTIHSTVPTATIDLQAGVATRYVKGTQQSIIAHQESDYIYSAIIVPQRIENRRPLIEVGNERCKLSLREQFLV